RWRVRFEPFCCEYPYDVTEWNLAERVSDILGDDRWNFRIAGPARMVFLLRAFHGLAYYFGGLGTPVFWQKAFTSCVGGLSDDMANLQIPPEKAPKCDFDSMARYLKIRVVEDGRTKVELTQYASTIEHHDELLDEEVKGRINEQKIDLKQIVSDVRRSNETALEKCSSRPQVSVKRCNPFNSGSSECPAEYSPLVPVAFEHRVERSRQLPFS
ncbi:MAG: hypothetical protein GY826_01940, partial [Fuerstiella sp.]|nr:hypothetical protein [Fuerstiella sp.]